MKKTKKKTKKGFGKIIFFIIIGIVLGGIATYLFITFNKKTFVVTFDTSGGSEVASITVECGKRLSLPNNPTRSGYTFVSWVDKNNLRVSNDILLACEDTTLTATWKKGSTKTATNTDKPTTSTTPTTTEDKETGKTYTCPAGYELTLSKKCVSRKYPTTTCASGYTYSSKQDLCYNVNETTPYTKKCRQEVINGKAYDGELLHKRGVLYYCAYLEVTTYKNSERSCEHANYIYSDINNKCYTRYIQNNYDTVCPAGYYDAKAKSLDNSINYSMCVKTKDAVESCEKGYYLENGVCYKFINPTIS